MVTSRPLSGLQFAFAADLLPFGDVTTTQPGSSRDAASAAFSPSVSQRDAAVKIADMLGIDPYGG
jgi:hypothetical protein